MLPKDIEKLNELRTAWDIYKSIDGERTQEQIDALYSVMWKHGIEGRSSLAAFNDQVCLDVLRQYRTIKGKCDKCAGYEGTPPCLVHFGPKSCYLENNADIDPSISYVYMLNRIRYTNKKAGIRTTAESEALLDAALIDAEMGVPYNEMDPSNESRRIGLAQFNVLDKAMNEKSIYARKTGRYHAFCPDGHGYYNEFKVEHLADILDILWEP